MAAVVERVAKRVRAEREERVRLGIIDEKGNLLKKPGGDDPNSPSGMLPEGAFYGGSSRPVRETRVQDEADLPALKGRAEPG